MSKTKFAKTRKTAIAVLCAVAVTCTGFAAACSPAVNDVPEDNETTRKEDTQLLKNGNFEFYGTIPEDAVYLIKNVESWTRSGDSSGVMSGIIDTSSTAWAAITDTGLKEKLDYNNDLSSSNPSYEDEYVDYNGMDSGDILYREPYAASLEESNIGDDEEGYAKDGVVLGGGKNAQRSYKDFLGITGDAESGFKYGDKTVYYNADNLDYYFDSDFTQPVRYAVIDNPQTHLGTYAEKDGKYYLGEQEILVDEDGGYWIDTDKDGKIDKLADDSVGNVLMIHNYPTNKLYNGIEQHYTSQSITLEANTAAEISVWVKTSDLKFDKGYNQLNDQDRGAYIEITQNVASTTIDSFKIKAINTEKILADNPQAGSNGWLKYTVYVNACDFASSTITINLGLGDSSVQEKVTGYAFFDDVEVKKFIDLTDEGCSYNGVKDQITANAASCSLTSEGDDKVFYADKQLRGEVNARYSACFDYMLDLAAETYSESASKVGVKLSDMKSTAYLTYEELRDKKYALAKENKANIVNFKNNDKADAYELPSDLKPPKPESGLMTFNDLVGIYGADKTAFAASDFNTGITENGVALRDLSARLTKGVFGEDGKKGISALSDFSSVNDMIVILSAYGAAYTAKIENTSPTPDGETTTTNTFGVNGTGSDEHYKIISFWIKTMDMDGKTAATIRLVDSSDEDNSAVLTVDSTGITTDVGDNENIYSDWVQCFFFVNNDTDTAKDFSLEFSFGATSITGASATSYNYGWAAIANVETLDVTEDVFKLVSEGTYAKTLTFGEDEPAEDTPFDSENSMSNVNSGVADPSNYNGVNGGSSYVTDKVFGDDYDMQNNNKGAISGLINRDGFESYDEGIQQGILGAFGAAANWSEAFGDDCYQPLIIVDSLREYRDRAKATEDNFKNYFIKNEDGTYSQVAEDATFDENTTYYSAVQVVKNYGYLGDTHTVSSSSYQTVSVKVKVAGNAEAWVYLVNSDDDKILNFETPEYTFYYDVDGNVLDKEYDEKWSDAERNAAIVYTLRDDGLYEDKDGKIYANLHNLTSRYQYSEFEHNRFYNEKGERVRYDELQDGVTYYSDEAHTKIATHYLVVGEQRLYGYDAETSSYYYLVNGERGVTVNNFDIKYARYSRPETIPQYAVKITDTNGEWVTVNFIIHTGNEAKNYRLELWSGERDKTGYTDGMTADTVDGKGAVAFDYSHYNIAESDYSTVLTQYETVIEEIYRDLIIAEGYIDRLDDDMNIADYEALIAELNLTDKANKKLEEQQLAGYTAQYYTFTWYDSAKYVPFNFETAEAGKTGYDYSITDESESLVYFNVYDGKYNSYNTFVDYSAIDKTVELASADTDTDTGSDDETVTNTNNSDRGLLITSIVLLVVLLFALIAVFVRYIWKKTAPKRRQKGLKNNNYKQRDRYMKKLGIEKTVLEDAEPEDTADGETVDGDDAETPADDVPADDVAEDTDTPADSGAPADDEVKDDAPADDGHKDE